MFIANSTFHKVRNKTKIIEMILGPLIIITGLLALHFQYNWSVPDFLFWKILLVSVAIPVSIIALKKSNKLIALIGIALFCYIYLIAKYKTLSLSQNETLTAPIEQTV